MKRLVFIGVIVIMMTSGCNVSKSNKQVKQGIIDACYTVLEYAPKDKDERIDKYLSSKQSKNDITQEQKQLIQSCLKRTQQSERWKK